MPLGNSSPKMMLEPVEDDDDADLDGALISPMRGGGRPRTPRRSLPTPASRAPAPVCVPPRSRPPRRLPCEIPD